MPYCESVLTVGECYADMWLNDFGVCKDEGTCLYPGQAAVHEDAIEVPVVVHSSSGRDYDSQVKIVTSVSDFGCKSMIIPSDAICDMNKARGLADFKCLLNGTCMAEWVK